MPDTAGLLRLRGPGLDERGEARARRPRGRDRVVRDRPQRAAAEPAVRLEPLAAQLLLERRDAAPVHRAVALLAALAERLPREQRVRARLERFGRRGVRAVVHHAARVVAEARAGD